jgi:hypothetical protein
MLRALRFVTDVLMGPILIAYFVLDMVREGSWWWLAGMLAMALVIIILLHPVLNWYIDRKCPSKWLGMYPCDRRRGHDGKHMSKPNLSGRFISWDDIEVVPDATDR